MQDGAQSAQLTDAERRSVWRALKRPVGQYAYERASQLTGVPKRTLHYWAACGLVIPDFNHFTPKQWSYRDLLFIRLFVQLRALKVKPEVASRRVSMVRSRLEDVNDANDALLRIQGPDLLLIGDDEFDALTGAQVFGGFANYLGEFDLLAPVGAHDSERHVWGPHLVRPSNCTVISPAVMAGEPCVTNSRVSSGSLWSLRKDRGLSVGDLAELYPDLTAESINDAVGLEDRIRRAA
jgi:uncharacterized protein (DUF433 family)